ALLHAVQQRRIAQLAQPVPAHVWHADAGQLRQVVDHAGQQAQALDVALVRAFVQQLHAQAYAHQRRLQATQWFDQALRVQAAHAFGRGTDAGQDHPVGTLQPGRTVDHLGLHAQAFQRVADRTEVGAAGIDDYNAFAARAHRTPLVDGRASPSRRMAWRSARASALKLASILWWSLSPLTVMCRFRPAASHSERKKCGTSSVGMSPTRSRTKLPS